MRILTLICLASVTISLTACDAAGEMAGDVIKEQIRTEFVSRCEQTAQDSGIASDAVGPACECAADNLAKDAADGSLEINQERLEELLQSCGASALEQGGDAAAESQPAS